jgi:hypothetical protein
MTIAVEAGTIRLTGRCGAEEAEQLLALLGDGIDRVDLSGCEHLHAALLQLLMASRPAITGTPAPFIARWLLPLVEAEQEESGG